MEELHSTNNFRGVWIDKDILRLIQGGNERILFSMITTLSLEGPCYASNKYFAQKLNLSKTQISRLVSKLRHKKLISVFVNREDGNKRTISIVKKYNSLNTKYNQTIDLNDDRLLTKSTTNNKDDNKEIKKDITLIGNLNSKSFYENEFKWFINLFNSISEKKYKGDLKTKKRLKNYLETGFSREDFEKAIRNLYSPNPHNDFHIKTSFKNATPNYLLRDGHLDKYLNVKWKLPRPTMRRLN